MDKCMHIFYWYIVINQLKLQKTIAILVLLSFKTFLTFEHRLQSQGIFI